MAKKEHRQDYRVEVTLRRPGDYGMVYIGGTKRTHKEWKRMGDDVVRQIKRHVDDIEHAQLVWETIDVCEHCGNEWEIYDDTGEPACCNKAQEEWAEETDGESN